MDRHNIPTLPVRQPKRKRIFAIRLTDEERAEIESLAKQLKLPDSYMARHFILEAVAYHRQVQQGERVTGEIPNT
jgi:predicted transcriptional regulator